jgi:galactose-1-phosphate uridylyltransferase
MEDREVCLINHLDNHYAREVSDRCSASSRITGGYTKSRVMEKCVESFDVCIVCALPEEAKAFIEVLWKQCEGSIEERISPFYKYGYRFAAIKNDKDELLKLHISWLPRYGSQEMTLHLSRVLEECQPRIAIMTGICAGNALQVQLVSSLLIMMAECFTCTIR